MTDLLSALGFAVIGLLTLLWAIIIVREIAADRQREE